MITIKFKEEIFELKNNLTELTIKEFEEICTILNNNELNTLDKWISIFLLLGMSEECLDNFDLNDFISLIQEFNLTTIEKNEVIKEFTLNNITYKAYDEEFRLTVKETSLIEGYIVKNENRYLGELISIIYKNIDTDKNINYDKAHIHHKAELFRKELKADIVIPIIAYLSKKLIKNLSVITDLNE